MTSLTLASTAELRTGPVMPLIRDPETATPSAQATTSTAAALSTAPPAASRARAGCQVILSPDPGADELEQPLPERRGEDHDEQRAERDQQRRVGVAQRDRRQPDAEQPAEQQPGSGERAGDEPLPVAGEGVGEHHEQRAASRGSSPRGRRREEVGVRLGQVLEVLGVSTRRPTSM